MSVCVCVRLLSLALLDRSEQIDRKISSNSSRFRIDQVLLQLFSGCASDDCSAFLCSAIWPLAAKTAKMARTVRTERTVPILCPKMTQKCNDNKPVTNFDTNSQHATKDVYMYAKLTSGKVLALCWALGE